jgi:hypothetical protein
MSVLDPARYGAAAALLARPRLPEMGPGTPDAAAQPLLAALTPATLFGPAGPKDAEAARACLAGLWLRHDFLEESHTISQSLETPEGSFWHAIMHRREPDPGNSKYWWRRVGKHPVLTQLAAQAPSVGYTFTTPEAFVDFCERVRGKKNTDEDLAQKIQLLEWQLLFDHCFRLAST